MIEALILAGELLVFGLLLLAVRKLDDKRPRVGLGLFDMTELEVSEQSIKKPKVPHA